tara:strand:+ start:730 stop:894 length:165 start_codon:yes stop_codon:yes gene_type:complete
MTNSTFTLFQDSKIYSNWTTQDLFDHLYFLEDQVWTTKTHYKIEAIKGILKSRK